MKNITLILLIAFSFTIQAQNVDSLLQVLKNTASDSLSHVVNTELGYSFMNSDPDSARTYFLSALDNARNIANNQMISSSLTLTGVTYYFNGQFEEAMGYYLQALPISEQSGNTKYAGIISNNIGAVYFEMQAYDQALPYYSKAIGLFEVAKDTFWLSNSLNNMGNLLEKTTQFDEALSVYQRSLDLAEISANDEAIGSAMSNLGNVYLALGQSDKALDQYNKGLIYQQRTGDKLGEAISYNNIGRIYIAQGAYRKALVYHNDALKMAKEMEHLETIKNANKWIAEAHALMNDFQNAYQYQSKYLVLKDSLTGLEKANAVEELNKKYESEKKEKEIAELQLDKKNSALALANSTNQRNVFISISVIVLLMTAFVFNRYSAKRKTNLILADKNQLIERSLDEKNTLLKEIHHRVKNNLQVISSLLNLQAGSLDDEAAIGAVKDGQSRVKSMALIHQKLYTADDVRGVDVQDYLESLAQELFAVFGLTNEEVDYEIDASGIKLDIDTVIPLGLILNELITNSLKYAFDKSKQGLIEIVMREENNKLEVTIKDNGVGMDEEQLKSSNSFGWKMIRSLSRKLKAEIAIQNDGGTTVQLSLSRYKLAV